MDDSTKNKLRDCKKIANELEICVEKLNQLLRQAKEHDMFILLHKNETPDNELSIKIQKVSYTVNFIN